MTIYTQDPDELQNEYFQELEEQWLKSQPRFTDTELVAMFGDTLDTMDDTIAELKYQRKLLVKEIKRRIEPYAHRDDADAYFARFCIKHFLIEKLVKIEESLFRIERLRRKKNQSPVRPKKGLTDAEIERARNMPIAQIAELHIGKLRKAGKNYMARCPFHEDNSPSFTLYSDSNKFYCFGCQAKGDVIAFIQRLLQCDFKTAIYSLIA